MPQSKSKPSEIAAEAKRLYIPHIVQTYPQFPARSIAYEDTTKIRIPAGAAKKRRLLVAVIEGDPVDVALDWHDSNCRDTPTGSTAKSTIAGSTIPVVCMANERRAGGEWESSTIAPEESLCRRSTLVQALATPSAVSSTNAHYPIRTTGGIYSPSVVVFRAGADDAYVIWKEFRALPVISVAPIRRPKLDDTGSKYSFEQERELMKDKMRGILRIAADRGHGELVMGAFGVGFGFKNPAVQVAKMWHEIMFEEAEFTGNFSKIVFAIESSSGSAPKGGLSDIEAFRQEFAPANISKTTYR